MLTWVTDQFTTLSTDIDETPYENELPLDYCQRIARSKALASLKKFPYAEFPIVTADTTVYLGNEILGKPENAAHAREILGSLQGRSHHVCTAVVLCSKPAGSDRVELISTYCDTEVKMKPLTAAMIQEYVATGDPMGKAGAYAIQNTDFPLVKSINGCYACVVGFPLCHLERLFNLSGIEFDVNFADRCKSHISYSCRINKKNLLKNSVFSHLPLELSI